MFKIFYPKYRFKKLTDIKPSLFSGLQLAIFDLDSTLVFSEKTDTTKEIIAWLGEIKKICRCVIVSNSKSAPKRAAQISQIFDCDVFLSRNRKPFKKLFRELENTYKFNNAGVIVVGDRLLTDILFGNLNQCATVLVEPIATLSATWDKIIHEIEKIILFLTDLQYNKSN